MRFRQFFLLNEADPMGGGMAPPPGGAGGMPPPPPAGGGMGGDPMGGGMGAPPGGMGGGGMGAQPTIPQHADVWTILDAILNHKPMPQEEQPQQQGASMGGMPQMGGAPPMGGMPPMMGGPPGGSALMT